MVVCSMIAKIVLTTMIVLFFPTVVINILKPDTVIADIFAAVFGLCLIFELINLVVYLVCIVWNLPYPFSIL